MRHRLTAAAALAAAFAFSTPAHALDQPDCDTLGQWATAHDTKETVTLAPEVTISALLADDRTVPVFGASAASWSRNDFNQVRKWLGDCRTANRKNKPVARRFYDAYQVVSRAARPVHEMEKARQRSTQAVDNLVNYHRSNTLTEVLDLARQALHGTDVKADMRGLRVTRSVKSEVQVLQNAHGYLAAADIDSLSAKLTAGAGDVKQAMAAQDEEFEALKRQLAEVPLNMEGARTLQKLSNDPLLAKIPRDAALEFQTAIMQKRRAINQAVRQQQRQKQAAAASVPVKVVAVMERLIGGDSVADVSLRGVKPGIPYLYAKKFMSTRFSYKAATGGDLMKEFGAIGRDVRRYKQAERRDGGRFEFKTMGKTVGQVTYTEHFTGPMDLNEPRNWLREKFGKPDKFQFLGNAFLMAWYDDGTTFVVSPGNRTTLPFRNPREYKSSLVVTMWSDDYKEYLAAAEKRCEELRNKPMSQLSVQDKMDMMRGCKN